jgi:hypothetical protein
MVRAYEADPRGAAIEFRKHLGWYVKGLPGSADLRRALHLVNDFAEIEGIFADYLARADEIGARHAAESADVADVADVADAQELETADA